MDFQQSKIFFRAFLLVCFSRAIAKAAADGKTQVNRSAFSTSPADRRYVIMMYSTGQSRMLKVFQAAILAITTTAHAAPAPQLRWQVSEGGDQEIKLGLTAPQDNTYAGLWMTCQRKSGVVQVHVPLRLKSLPAAAEFVRKNRGIEITLRSNKVSTIAYPGLSYNQHDEIWQFEVRLNIDDPFFAGLASTGRIEIMTSNSKQAFSGDNIAKVWPEFFSVCRQ